jgi:hypothetical protein
VLDLQECITGRGAAAEVIITDLKKVLLFYAAARR